jgi:hypothetical protein
LKTSLRRRYLDSVEAKSALLALVRSKLWLQAFLASETVLSLSADRKGVHWLWTVTPWLVTLREQMAHADAASDERALGRALGEFAKTAVASLALAVRSGVAMDVHPSNFARDGGRTVYLDDDIRKGNALPAIGYNLLQRVEEYEHRPLAIEIYLGAIEEAIPAGLSRDEAERLGLEAAIEQAVVRSEVARRAQSRLRGVVSRSAFAVEGA